MVQFYVGCIHTNKATTLQLHIALTNDCLVYSPDVHDHMGPLSKSLRAHRTLERLGSQMNKHVLLQIVFPSECLLAGHLWTDELSIWSPGKVSLVA